MTVLLMQIVIKVIWNWKLPYRNKHNIKYKFIKSARDAKSALKSVVEKLNKQEKGRFTLTTQDLEWNRNYKLGGVLYKKVQKK